MACLGRLVWGHACTPGESACHTRSLCLRFHGCPVEWRHWRYKLLSIDMGNLYVCNDIEGNCMEIVVSDWQIVIVSQFQRLSYVFRAAKWLQTWATLYVWNGLGGNWKLWYLTDGLWYSHNFKGFSYVFRAAQLNGDIYDTNFRWQTWATLYVWNGIEGNWKLWYLTDGLWYSDNFKGFSYVFCMSGMASRETGSCGFWLTDCDILTISKAFPIFSGLPSWTETLTLRTSEDWHGQPPVCLEWHRGKLEVVVSDWWIVIFWQFQRLFLCFQVCQVE